MSPRSSSSRPGSRGTAPPPLPHSFTHSLTHLLTYSLNHSLNHSTTQPLNHSTTQPPILIHPYANPFWFFLTLTHFYSSFPLTILNHRHLSWFTRHERSPTLHCHARLVNLANQSVKLWSNIIRCSCRCLEGYPCNCNCDCNCENIVCWLHGVCLSVWRSGFRIP